LTKQLLVRQYVSAGGAVVADDEMSMYLQATTTAVWAPKGQTPSKNITEQYPKEADNDPQVQK
jgi:hypothetical protein